MKLAVVGRISHLEPIAGADRIRCATVDCGDAGIWQGVVGLDIEPEQCVTVFLQDAILPADNPRWAFMAKHKFRVRMARFIGVPSECVIIPGAPDMPNGIDLTEVLGVTKYTKALPAALSGDAVGAFPSYIHKTDETNFQASQAARVFMESSEWDATLKYDGTSCTAWNDADGQLHVASRNLELREFNATGAGNTYWRCARLYTLDSLPIGTAIQFEIIGPGIQGNPTGTEAIQARAFTLYDFVNHRRCTRAELEAAALAIGMPAAQILAHGEPGCHMTPDELRDMAEIHYANGKPAEGIVVRACDSSWSFKVINLNYKD